MSEESESETKDANYIVLQFCSAAREGEMESPLTTSLPKIFAINMPLKRHRALKLTIARSIEVGRDLR